jgi:error-prone DNA polymerase
VNHSRWDCTLEATNHRYHAVRLGLNRVTGLEGEEAARIVLARGNVPYRTVEEVQRRAGVGAGALNRIGEADGLGSLEHSRRSGLWSVKGLGNAPLPLFAAADERERQFRDEVIEPIVALAAMSDGAEVVEDYRSLGLSLRAHPVAFLREELDRRKIRPCSAIREMKDGRGIDIAGLVLVRQKPGSAKGVMFITLEDESGIANLVVWPDLFEKHRRVVLGSAMMGVRGRVQREGDVIHIVAQRLDDLSPMLATVGQRGDARNLYPVARADVVKSPMSPDPRDPAQRPLGRNPRDIFIPDLRLGSGIIPGQPTGGIKIKPRDFR